MPTTIDDYAPREKEQACDVIFDERELRARRPGVVAFRDAWLRDHGGFDVGIARECPADGIPDSHHHESRAWDWGPAVGEPVTEWRARTLPLVRALTSPDKDGNPDALARRLGLFSIIFNRESWSSVRRAWNPREGDDPHTTHVHFSFSWAGALGETSGYQARSMLLPLAIAGGAVGAALLLVRLEP